MVVVDSLGASPEVLDEAKKIASKKTGLRTDRMLICSTHTHSGPPSNTKAGPAPAVAYRKVLVGGLAESIVQAYSALQPASVGAALGHKEAGRLAVNFQRDGDLMFYPGALWTAAHHNIPLLSVMHNNRAYHAETMIVQRTAAERRRGLDGSSRIGTVMDDPAIDFSGLAKSLGVWSTDTITDPKDLAPALKKALEVIDAGEPALLDVFCPGR